jgi:hypothetical protein
MNTINEILDRTLDKGILQSNNELDICCPDCVQNMNDNNVSIYTISSVETFLKFSEAIGFNEGITPTCCPQITASVETSLKFNEAFGASPTNPVPSCSTNFNECMNTLKNSLTSEGVDRLLDKGVVEYGSLSGFSQICRIDEFIDLSISLDPQSSTKAEIIDRIIDKGIVVSCYDDEIVISSVETWLKYAEANGLTAIPA